MRRWRAAAALAAPLVLVAAAARAAHPLITEDPGTQGAGRWQLEMNAEAGPWSRSDDAPRHVQPAATLTYGPAETVDVLVTQAWLRQSDDSGSASGAFDSVIDVKWRFFERGAWSAALKPGITLPTGRDAEDFGAGRVAWGSVLVLQYARGPWTLLGNAAYRENRNVHGDRQSLPRISGAALFEVREGLRLLVDTALDTNPDPDAPRRLRQTVLGAIYSVTRDLDLDAGIRSANDPSLDRAVLVGIALRW